MQTNEAEQANLVCTFTACSATSGDDKSPLAELTGFEVCFSLDDRQCRRWRAFKARTEEVGLTKVRVGSRQLMAMFAGAAAFSVALFASSQVSSAAARQATSGATDTT